MADQTKTPHTGRYAEVTGRPAQSSAQPELELRRARTLRLLLITLALAYLCTAGFTVYLYLRTRVWQMLFATGSIALGILMLILAWRQVRRRALSAGLYWILGGISFAFGGAELAWAGGTLYFAAGGAVVIVFVCSLTIPRKWRAWVALVTLYEILILLINALEPIQRYHVIRSPLLRNLGPGICVLLGALILLRVASALLRGTIRHRLLFAFTMMALLLAGGIGASAILVSGPTLRQQAINQLESVATLKEAAIEAWVETLQSELSTLLMGSDAVQEAKAVTQGEARDSVQYGETYSQLKTRFQQTIALTGRFEELFLVDVGGRVVVSTDTSQEGKSRQSEAFFQGGLEGPYITPPIYSPVLQVTSVFVAQPVKDQDGETVAVLAGRAGMDRPNEIMAERSGLGDSGVTYLVGINHALLTKPVGGGSGRLVGFAGATERLYAYTLGANAAIDDHLNGSGLYENYDVVPVVGVFRWLPRFQVALLAEQDQQEALAGTDRMMKIMVGLAMGATLIAVTASVLITNGIVNPLASLAETAQAIAAGEHERTAAVERNDEVGALARAFNSMTRQLRDLIISLEERIAARTSDLERRSAYLIAAGEVGRAVSSILAPGELVQQVAELIRQRFDLYYVGLFLVESSGEWVELRAGTGAAGEAMLARGHRIRVGEGMIGWCVVQGEARVALEADDDSVRLRTKELPDTRSEAAIPLRARGRVLGALTVQHSSPGAFDPEIVSVLQTMADQVAVALANAQLFEENRLALEAERRAYAGLQRDAWLELVRTQHERGYRYISAPDPELGQAVVLPLTGEWQTEMVNAIQEAKKIRHGDRNGLTLALPIRAGDQVVGALSVVKEKSAGQWTDEETDLLEALVDQLAIALENARLYQQSQLRAARESMAGEIAANLRQSLDFETVLRTAAQDIRRMLELPEVTIRLVPPAEQADIRWNVRGD
jgi:GAF domain-containing protein/HAMP domain-containing protein